MLEKGWNARSCCPCVCTNIGQCTATTPSWISTQLSSKGGWTNSVIPGEVIGPGIYKPL